jgi:biotin transport system substrate-specific component
MIRAELHLKPAARTMLARDHAAPRRLVDQFWPAGAGPARLAVLALFGSLLLTVSAKVQVPFYPVPMTLQTLVVFLLGIAYGPRLAFATVVFYLAQGAVGLPVFAGTPEKGIGLAYMIGPTGGYLVGFAAAAAVAGWVAERSRGVLTTALGIAAATATIYVLGAGWLATMVGVEKAVALGVVPFLLGDVVKLALATALAEVGLSRLRLPAA